MISLATEPNVSIEPLIDRQRTIESYTDSECWNIFETRKEDLQRLLLNQLKKEQMQLVGILSFKGLSIMVGRASID
jgi:hypothetical protein